MRARSKSMNRTWRTMGLSASTPSSERHASPIRKTRMVPRRIVEPRGPGTGWELVKTSGKMTATRVADIKAAHGPPPSLRTMQATSRHEMAVTHGMT